MVRTNILPQIYTVDRNQLPAIVAANTNRKAIMSTPNGLIEVIPPERDERGHFKPGHAGGPGRPGNQPIGFTRMMRDALSESFAIVGGTDYLVMLAYWKPDLYVSLVGRAMPIKIAGDDEGITVIGKVNRVITKK